MIRLAVYAIGDATDLGAVGRALADLCRNEQPDVVCLLGAPRRLATRRLARDAGLDVAVRTRSRQPGTAILAGARVRVTATSTIALPAGAPPDPGPDAGPETGSETGSDPDPVQRAPGDAAEAVLLVGSQKLSVLAATLGNSPELRARRGQRLLETVRDATLPTILGIDLGEPPSGPEGRRLTAELDDAFARAGQGHGETYPTPTPTVRRDVILVTAELAVSSAVVPDRACFDLAGRHRPVVVEIAAPTAEPERLDLRDRREPAA